MKDYSIISDAILGVDGVKRISECNILSGDGRVEFEIEPTADVFYKLLSELSGDSIEDEFKLMSYVKELNVAKENYRN